MALSDRIIGAEGSWVMGSFIPNELLDQLPEHLATMETEDVDAVMDTVRRRTAELIDADEDLAADKPAQAMLAMSAVVLAAYEALEPRLGADRAILLLRHIFGEVLRRSMQAVTKVLTHRKDPLGALDTAMQQSSKMYGPSAMDFSFDRPDDDTFVMTVTRCAFKDFFERHGARPVTTVLCSWDANWMKAIDTPVTGLRAERASLLSLGADACSFRVTTTDDPSVGYRDALDEAPVTPES